MPSPLPYAAQAPTVAYTDYAGLQNAIAKFLNRTDLTDAIPGFIAMAESTMNLRLRTNDMLALFDATQAPGEAFVPVPDDWLEFDTLGIANDKLEYISPTEWWSRHRDGNPGRTTGYTIMGRSLYTVGPLEATAPAVPVSGTYYQSLPVLAANQTTWLLKTHPEAYLYGAMASAWQYVLDEQRASMNAGLFNSLIDLMNADTIKARHSGSQWRQRPR